MSDIRDQPIQVTDILLAVSLLVGLVWTPVLLLIPVAALIRSQVRPVVWAPYHTFMLIAGLLGVSVITIRGVSDATGLILQYFFIWSIPFVFLYYRPTAATVKIVAAAVFFIFTLDLAFNVLGTINGSDLLGRSMDERSGTLGARMGGIFGHAFYSGSISISALTVILSGKRRKAWAALPIVNLLIAGSWRLTIAAPILILFYAWKKRAYWQELLVAFCISAFAVFATVYTSGLVESDDIEVNDANTLRVFAWVSAIDKIQDSPLIGVGYPKDNTLAGVSAQTIDESLTAESWYLGSAITFGIPYTVIRFIGLLLLFAHHRHNEFCRIAGPFIIIDLAYGGFFDGTLFYVLMWTYVAATNPENTQHHMNLRGAQPIQY